MSESQFNDYFIDDDFTDRAFTPKGAKLLDTVLGDETPEVTHVQQWLEQVVTTKLNLLVVTEGSL